MLTERQAAAETAARLLREIIHYQQCLKAARMDTRRAYLVDAYRKEISTRRHKLDVIPPLPEPVDNPWS